MKITIELELALAVTFITLKLCGVIDWSWWLVLLPLHASILFAFALFGIGLFFHLLIIALEFIDKKIINRKIKN